MLRHFRLLANRFPRPELSLGVQHQQVAAVTHEGGDEAAALAEGWGAQPEPMPLSQALVQLEQLVTDAGLPGDVLDANEASLLTLKSFIRRMANPRPRPTLKNLWFTVRRGKRLKRVQCQLRSTGDKAGEQVASSLGEALGKMGLSPHIYFDRDALTPSSPNQGAEPKDVESVRARAAKAGFVSQTITEEEFRELEKKQQAQREARGGKLGAADQWSAKLRRVDPLFAAVAAVPWMSEEDERQSFMTTRVMDELEAQGWDIRGAAHRIWRGERELSALVEGKDAGSQAAIQSLVFHAKKLEEQFGRKTLGDDSGSGSVA